MTASSPVLGYPSECPCSEAIPRKPAQRACMRGRAPTHARAPSIWSFTAPAPLGSPAAVRESAQHTLVPCVQPVATLAHWHDVVHVQLPRTNRVRLVPEVDSAWAQPAVTLDVASDDAGMQRALCRRVGAHLALPLPALPRLLGAVAAAADARSATWAWCQDYDHGISVRGQCAWSRGQLRRRSSTSRCHRGSRRRRVRVGAGSAHAP